MSDLYINNNGEILSADSLNLNLNNRSFRYGDAIFESIRIVNGKAFGLDAHFNRLQHGLKTLHINLPEGFSLLFLKEKIDELIEKNQIKEGGRCRLTIYRANGGFFSPSSREGLYAIEIEPLLANYFELNEIGLSADLYPDIRKQVNKMSQLKTANGLLYILAALYAQEHELDECILQNNKFEIIEATSSNLFIVSNGVLYTPDLQSGCVGGTMRMQIINLAIKNGISVYESNVTPSNLLVADEVLLTNAISGIRWVGSYKTKRYFHNTAQKLVDLLNEQIKNS